jgi:DNA-directed RNA polymerase specialized sigma24 family protein
MNNKNHNAPASGHSLHPEWRHCDPPAGGEASEGPGRGWNEVIHNIPAFAEYVSNYHIVLFRYARFITRNQQAADNICDAVLNDLWLHRQQLPSQAAIRSFLQTSVRTASHAWLHKNILSLRHRHCDAERSEAEATSFEKP